MYVYTVFFHKLRAIESTDNNYFLHFLQQLTVIFKIHVTSFSLYVISIDYHFFSVYYNLYNQIARVLKPHDLVSLVHTPILFNGTKAVVMSTTSV